MNYRLVAPNGCEIVGTLETIPAVAMLHSPRPDRQDRWSFEWTGDTKVDWDNQRTVVRVTQGKVGRPREEMIFIDEKGQEWPRSELRLEKVEENADA